MIKQIRKFAEKYIEENRANYVPEDIAISPELAGMRIFDAPLVGVASADDPMWEELKNTPKAYGDDLKLPNQWLPEAKTIITMFFPFTERVKNANAGCFPETAAEWLHGRIEGQAFIAEFVRDLEIMLQEKGALTAVPCISPDFEISQKTMRSNWSERHAAFIGGLGTFGLSKGMITEKGMAGRFTSVITNLDIPATERSYAELYEYCINCGACIKRCPAEAITTEGKNHLPCFKYLNKTGEMYAPRYGCGKCQTGVPCESEIPGGKASE